MEEITSRENRHIKEYCKLAVSKKERDETGRFVLESVKLVLEAFQNGVSIEKVFLTPQAEQKYQEKLFELLNSGVETYRITPEIGKKMSEAETPQGVFALCRKLDKSLAMDTIKRNGVYAALCDLQDPGNLGTLFRTAEALGVAGIILSPGCCDVYNPKVLRAAMGSVFRMPFLTVSDFCGALNAMSVAECTTCAAVVADKAESVTDIAFDGGVAVIGNEGNGLSPAVADCCDRKITIRMKGNAESLNAAMAAGIILVADDAVTLNAKHKDNKHKGGIAMPENNLYWIWLSELFARGSDVPNRLLDRFETPERIFEATDEELAASGLLNTAELSRISRRSLERSAFLLKECERLQIKTVTLAEPLYPEKLKQIFGAPAVLYYYGDLTGLNDTVTLGVVGTRKPSAYGRHITDELCYQLAAAGAVIVSGCAVGIDSCAHLGALKAEGKTVAVLGCGLDIDYPAENNGLKREILLHGGALISELPPGSSVSGKYFPTRNRLISGLSNGVIVTEAPLRSGAAITLNLALEQGRDVFCVPPHDIHDSAYCGVVKPLREGAIPVYGTEDVLDEYYSEYSHKLNAEKAIVDYIRYVDTERPMRQVADNMPPRRKAEPAEKPAEPLPAKQEPTLEGLQKTVYDVLTQEPQYVNDLAAQTGLTLPELLSALTELEIEGYAASYSGQRYGRM